MKINCIYCNTPAKVEDFKVKLKCMCDDDHRILCLNKIKNGYYSDLVYLFDDNKRYDKKESIFCIVN